MATLNVVPNHNGSDDDEAAMEHSMEQSMELPFNDFLHDNPAFASYNNSSDTGLNNTAYHPDNMATSAINAVEASLYERPIALDIDANTSTQTDEEVARLLSNAINGTSSTDNRKPAPKPAPGTQRPIMSTTSTSTRPHPRPYKSMPEDNFGPSRKELERQKQTKLLDPVVSEEGPSRKQLEKAKAEQQKPLTFFSPRDARSSNSLRSSTSSLLNNNSLRSSSTSSTTRSSFSNPAASPSNHRPRLLNPAHDHHALPAAPARPKHSTKSLTFFKNQQTSSSLRSLNNSFSSNSNSNLDLSYSNNNSSMNLAQSLGLTPEEEAMAIAIEEAALTDPFASRPDNPNPLPVPRLVEQRSQRSMNASFSTLPPAPEDPEEEKEEDPFASRPDNPNPLPVPRLVEQRSMRSMNASFGTLPPAPEEEEEGDPFGSRPDNPNPLSVPRLVEQRSMNASFGTLPPAPEEGGQEEDPNPAVEPDPAEPEDMVKDTFEKIATPGLGEPGAHDTPSCPSVAGSKKGESDVDLEEGSSFHQRDPPSTLLEATVERVTPEEERPWYQKPRVVSAILAPMIVLLLAVIVPLAVLLSKSSAAENAEEALPTNMDTSSTIKVDPRLPLVPGLTNSSIQVILEDASSAQAQAYNWISTDPAWDTYQDWRKYQRFAMASFLYSMSHQNNLYVMSHQTTECYWILGLDACEGSETDRVQSLRITGDRMPGSMPSTLGLLTSLTSLDLSKNGLTSTIPSEVGLLTDLKSLVLSSNDLTGRIPNQIGILPNLTVFDTWGNVNVESNLPQGFCSADHKLMFTLRTDWCASPPKCCGG